MKILWCGPCPSDKAIKVKPEVNLAAAKWSRGLLSGLAEEGHEIVAIDACPNRCWPGGRTFWQSGARDLFWDRFPCERISYLNCPFLKDKWLTFAYGKATRRLLSHDSFDIVLCYNSLHPQSVATMRAAAGVGVKSVPIILDGRDPREDNWSKILNDNRFASGVVFLSKWAQMHYPDMKVPVFHLDGGADRWNGREPDQSSGVKKVVYTGALDRWRGFDFIQKVIRKFKDPSVRFMFCGKYGVEAQSFFKSDARIENCGLVSKHELVRICNEADVFLNVREPSLGYSILNFPSKMTQYLSFGRPVVSLWVDSLDSVYKDYLQIPRGIEVDDFVQTLKSTLAWNDERRMEYYVRAKEWFSKEKLWRVQARRLSEWLRTEVGR